jgi:hypothetical protein
MKLVVTISGSNTQWGIGEQCEENGGIATGADDVRTPEGADDVRTPEGLGVKWLRMRGVGELFRRP